MAAVKKWPHCQGAYASADGTLVTGKVGVHSIVVSGDGSNNATLELIDGGSGGTSKVTVGCAGTATTVINLGKGYIPFGTDVYANLTGTDATCAIVYSELL